MYRKIKRVMDFLLAVLALPFFLLILIVIAPLIYFSDYGPVFYNSYRLGVNGKKFKMYKFRSMKINAPDIRLADGSTYNGDDDPRITKIGRFLRKTSIDELPQIFNILNGTMSFIGPRPDPLDWLERYTDEEKIVLTVKPGISGYNQAYFRNNADGRTKLNNDMYYAENISFGLDTKIFIKTIKTVLLRENINIDKSRLSEKK